MDPEGPLQLQVSSLDYDSYVGMLGIGRITRGRATASTTVSIVGADGKVRMGKLGELFGFLGLNRYKVEQASAGDIVVFSGIEELFISDTVCDREHPEALPPLKVDEPTITMTFQVNKSPFAGKEGKFLTSRHIKERLERELKHNVALRVEPTGDPDKFQVSGRGELHLSILIENMRREGYELAVSRPEVILQEIDGETCEPWEQLTVDFEEAYQGAVMSRLAERKGQRPADRRWSSARPAQTRSATAAPTPRCASQWPGGQSRTRMRWRGSRWRRPPVARVTPPTAPPRPPRAPGPPLPP